MTEAAGKGGMDEMWFAACVQQWVCQGGGVDDIDIENVKVDNVKYSVRVTFYAFTHPVRLS